MLLHSASEKWLQEDSEEFLATQGMQSQPGICKIPFQTTPAAATITDKMMMMMIFMHHTLQFN